MATAGVVPKFMGQQRDANADQEDLRSPVQRAAGSSQRSGSLTGTGGGGPPPDARRQTPGPSGQWLLAALGGPDGTTGYNWRMLLGGERGGRPGHFLPL